MNALRITTAATMTLTVLTHQEVTCVNVEVVREAMDISVMVNDNLSLRSILLVSANTAVNRLGSQRKG